MELMSGYSELGLRALNGIVNTLEVGLDKAPDYVVDLVGRFGMYRGVTGIILSIVSIAVFIFGIYFTIRGFKTVDRYDEPSVGMISIGVCSIILGFVCTCIWVDMALTGFIVPEVSLISAFTPSCGCH